MHLEKIHNTKPVMGSSKMSKSRHYFRASLLKGKKDLTSIEQHNVMFAPDMYILFNK